MEKTPLVSIRCTVYNHEPFLRQCLDGFVMQKTTFPFEAIVHDDASTDGSAAIIQEYAEKYPDIIKPIFEIENQYSKHDGSIGRIMEAAMHPNSKYIAFCEGDDYWTDPNKLQLQVDFLESHSDYVLCSHNFICFDQEKGLYYKHSFYEWLFGKHNELRSHFDFSLDNYFEDWWTQPLTCMYRKGHYIQDMIQKGYTDYRDNVYYYNVLKYGKGILMGDVMGTYRIHSGGIWSEDDRIAKTRRLIANAFMIYQIEGDRRAFAKTRRCTLRLLDELRAKGEKGFYIRELVDYYKRVPISEFLRLLFTIMREQLNKIYNFLGKKG